MRIAFDAKRAFLNQSGLGNYSRDLIRSLYNSFPDHHYSLYTPSIGKGLFNDISNTNIDIISPPESFGKLRRAYWRSYQSGKTLLQDKQDLFHGLSNELPQNIESLGVKSIVTIHDLIFMRYPHWYKSIDRAIYKKKFLSASLRADKVIATSQQTKNDLIAYFGIEETKIEVVFQTCHKGFWEEASEKQQISVKEQYALPQEYLLSVGTIEERKNLLRLIEAIHNHKIDMPLVVLGKPTSYLKKVQSYIAKNHVQGIHFPEQVAFSDFPAIYQGAAALVYPSVFEGFGIPILEALASGTPVITSKTGCFPEVGGESSSYIDPSKTDDIADAIKNLLNDSARQQAMREKGLKHAQLFREERLAKQVMNLYQQVKDD